MRHILVDYARAQQKMRAVLPLHVFPVDQPDVSLVHQHRGCRYSLPPELHKFSGCRIWRFGDSAAALQIVGAVRLRIACEPAAVPGSTPHLKNVTMV
jgi:hypothetical protein